MPKKGPDPNEPAPGPLLAGQDSQSAAQPVYSPMPYVDPSAARIEYDSAKADEAVKFPQLLFDARFWRLGYALLSFIIGSSISVLYPAKDTSKSDRLREKAQSVRQLLFDLGPTFIKLGQFLSVRRDMLPIEVAEELALLQDKVPPFELDQVRETIKADLGSSPEMLFERFDKTPIASASIGQVHRVTLKDGSEAVIKIQRPDLARQFYRDLGLMRLAARWWLLFTKVKSKFGQPAPPVKTIKQPMNMAQQAGFSRHRPLDVKGWLELSDEFGRVLFSEIDYLKEGRNADRLRKLVRAKPEIRIPRVHWRFTGRHVLTLEYIPGIKISQVQELRAKGFDLEKLGTMLVNCYLEQFVLTGFFHADPHAGNLAIDSDGRLIIYDFGMMGEITEEHRHALLACVMAVVRRDADMVTSSLQELGIVSKTAPADAVSRTIAPFIDYYAGRDIMDLDFHNLENDIDHVVSERSFRLPANLAYLLRAGSSLEGIARTLKPDFSFAAAVRPVMTKWALQQGIESLAKNGKLLTFAQFALNEIRASIKQPQNHGSAEVTSNGRKTQPVPKSVSETSGKQSGKQVPSVPMTKEVSTIAPAPVAECCNCAQHKGDIQRGHRKLAFAYFLLSTYLVISNVSLLTLWFVSSLVSRPITLYLLIGNSVLGAIIFWKFHVLLKWSSQRSAEVEKSRGNGER